MEYVWLALAVAVMAFFTWFGFRIEPHWVAKDLSRFIGNAQLMTDKGEPVGRFRETRVLIEPNGEMFIDQRRFMRRRDSSVFRLMAESDDPPRSRAVFVMRGHTKDGTPALLAIRVPARSRIAPHLRAMLARPPGATDRPGATD